MAMVVRSSFWTKYSKSCHLKDTAQHMHFKDAKISRVRASRQLASSFVDPLLVGNSSQLQLLRGQQQIFGTKDVITSIKRAAKKV
eukprot:scaffold16124_cov94-Skeletonema_dohrnii-CCMP3373.AAC.1